MAKLTYKQLYNAYREAMETIYEYEWQMKELKEELDLYIQAFEELQYELSKYR